MSRILITGADGFIGSHLAELLVRQGYAVRAMVLYNSFGQSGWLDHSPLRSEVELFSGDVRDSDSCVLALRSVGRCVLVEENHPSDTSIVVASRSPIEAR